LTGVYVATQYLDASMSAEFIGDIYNYSTGDGKYEADTFQAFPMSEAVTRKFYVPIVCEYRIIHTS